MMDVREYGAYERIKDENNQPIKLLSELSPEIEIKTETYIRHQMKECIKNVINKYPEAEISREFLIWDKDDEGLKLGWFLIVRFKND